MEATTGSQVSQIEAEAAQVKPETEAVPAAPGVKAKNAKTVQNAKVKEAKSTKPAAAAKGKAAAAFLTPARIEQLKKILDSLKNESNQALKDMLRKNNQSMSGNKTDLLGKVADGKMFGRIPKCPTCHGGRLAFDLTAGEYRCNGYYEDQAFYQCTAVFPFSGITREPWTD